MSPGVDETGFEDRGGGYRVVYDWCYSQILLLDAATAAF